MNFKDNLATFNTMNLQTHIKKDLWLAVQSTYEAGNFSHAILDAMHHLSNVLRDKTGADGDGAALVGQALGGESPRLRINKLQTETERNEQRGLESILRGMYQAIRNPRSHEQSGDSKETADAIIVFIDYLLGIIGKSEEPFVQEKFMGRIFDPDFFKSQHYAELLVNEIPSNKLFDVLIAIYRRKLEGDVYSIGLVVRALIIKLSDDQIKRYVAIVSEELSEITDEKDFKYNLHLLPPHLWVSLSETSRLRVENRVIRAIREGESRDNKCIKGALATWARKHFPYFTLKDQVGETFIEKLESDNLLSKYYVAELFLPQLSEVISSPTRIRRCVIIISESIRKSDGGMQTALLNNIYSLPEKLQKDFAESLKDLTDESNPAIYLPDGAPFLVSTQPKSDEDENLPF